MQDLLGRITDRAHIIETTDSYCSYRMLEVGNQKKAARSGGSGVTASAAT